MEEEMRVLVGYASKYGATDEIAQEIGRELTALDLDVTVAPLDEAKADGYDAYVLGSAVYAGSWLKEARNFIKANHALLLNSHVWLFSSGPVGRPLKPAGDPEGVASLLKSIAPEDHVVFAGKLDKKRLNIFERAIVRVFKAQLGDYRDWEAIRRWTTDEIAPKLRQAAATT
jgi:menaquinone-dependent protoporphyrinogen oxidase